MKKFLLLLFPLLIFALLAFEGCRPDPPWGEGILELSTDTVQFDTIFTTFPSPTERLVFRNPTKSRLKIDAIYLNKGDASEFSLIVDGLTQNRVEDFELAAGDSAIIFVDFTSQMKDDFARDRIVFEVNGQSQWAEVEAYVMDAYFYSAPKDSILVLDCNTVFDNTKPIVIDGIVRVQEGCQLTILAGTQLFFTPRKDGNFNLISMIDVWGTLDVQGALGNEVVFQQTRFGDKYFENPAQWRGIRMWVTSQNSHISHAILKNGLIGIEVDSLPVNGNPKLLLEKTEIRNMGGYGLLGVGAGWPNLGDAPIIQATNTLIHNCKENNLLFYAGGTGEFYNCTFVNYSISFSRQDPQIGLSNYFVDTADLANPFPIDVNFYNCIIEGSEEEEVGFDTIQRNFLPFELSFTNCLIRSTVTLDGTDNLFNTDPLFTKPKESDPSLRDYTLLENSPCIDAGLNYGSLYPDDKLDVLRDASFDLGAYEFVQ
ncbi:MAG: hypothetical protein H6581_29435 [Bacteroidia bacterium]|nr:hypothetical protein [Bacteroidia bacterium]